MVTTKLSYSHTIGIASFEGRGFMNPIDVKFKNDLLLKGLQPCHMFQIDLLLKTRPSDERLPNTILPSCRDYDGLLSCQ